MSSDKSSIKNFKRNANPFCSVGKKKENKFSKDKKKKEKLADSDCGSWFVVRVSLVCSGVNPFPESNPSPSPLTESLVSGNSISLFVKTV